MTTKMTTITGENAFLKWFLKLKTFSHMEMYKFIDGKVEQGVKCYNYGNHTQFALYSSLLIVDKDFCDES